MTDSIGAGTTSRASAAYQKIEVCGVTFARAKRWANFGRWSTSASSARRGALVESVIAPVRAASSTWRGFPYHKSPETTVLVSATTCTGGTPFRTRGVDFRLYFGLGERSERQCSKPIRRFEQMCHPAALHLCSQQGFQHRGRQ